MRVIQIFFFSLVICFSGHSQLKINEFLPSNLSGIVDEDGDFKDWIELLNSGSTALNLSDYSLTDEIEVPDKWSFPEIELAPADKLVVFASGKNRKTVQYTYTTLIDRGDEWKYILPESEPNAAWRNTGFADTEWLSGTSGFGYADDDDVTLVPNGVLSVFVRKEFTISDLASIERLILNIDYDDGFVAYINGTEVARANIDNGMAAVPFNYTTPTDREATIYQGGAPEQFEVDNPKAILSEGNNVIAIQIHNISSTSSDMTLIPLLTIARSGEGENNYSSLLNFPSSGNLHTNFKLKAEGESFYLFNHEGILVDSISATSVPADVSYGRQPDGGNNWFFFSEPTPGDINQNGVSQIMTHTVHFSTEGGYFPGGLSVGLHAESDDDVIYYTLDGSSPTESSRLYTGPLAIKGNTVVRARTYHPDALPGPVTTNSYLTELDHSLPVVSLSTNPEFLWDNGIGIYALGSSYESADPHYGANFWEDWERPIHFEYFDTEGIKKIDQVAGIKIFGGWSRAADQKSVALFARSDYGKGAFKYRFFKNKPIDKFESIVLRNSGNDNMRLQFQDCFMTGLTRDMDIDRQAYQPTAVYFNGEYWGILNMREKINEHFITENHLIDRDEVNLLEYDGSTIYGSNAGYLQIKNKLAINTSLESAELYQWMKDRIDINSYIQYQLSQIYFNNTDWPGNNIKFWNSNLGSKWRWILFDTDFGFGLYGAEDYQNNTLQFALATDGDDWPNPPWSTLLFRRLLTNTEFRHSFINQYCDRINVDFSLQRIKSDLDSLHQLYYPEMGNHFNRWWGSYADWENEIDNRIIFAESRPEYARLHLQQEFNLGEQLTISLEVNDTAAGRVQVNSVFPESYPFSGVYFESVPIKLKAIPKPGYKFVRWEGTKNSFERTIDFAMTGKGNFKAIFEEATAEDVSIVINEINYSSIAEYDTKDWLELVNNGNSTVDLEGWSITDAEPDSGYIFPAGLFFPPGEYLVICRDLGDFRAINSSPTISALGNMPFGLSSNGESLRLYDADLNVVDAVDYFPYAPWPTSADSTGLTLELKLPSLQNMDGANWKAETYGGTPGAPNAGVNAVSQIPTEELAGLECFPNPFTDFTTIQFTVEEEGTYDLSIFDMNGRLVKKIDYDYLTPGTYSVDWLGDDKYGNNLRGGVYNLRLSTENKIATKKVIMLK